MSDAVKPYVVLLQYPLLQYLMEGLKGRSVELDKTGEGVGARLSTDRGLNL